MPARLSSRPVTDVDVRLSLVGLNLITCSADQSGRFLSAFNQPCTDAFNARGGNSVCAYVLCDGKYVAISFKAI